MKSPAYFIAINILLSFVTCSSPPENRQFDRGQIEKEVTTMLHDYHASMKDHGIAGEFDYLDNSSDFFWVPPGFQSKLDYDSVKVILEQTATVTKSISLEWRTLEVFPLSNEIATYTGIVESTMTDTANNVNEAVIIESGTVIKRSDGWKLLSGQSAVLPLNVNEQ